MHFEQLTMQRSIWRMPPQAVTASKLAATRQRATWQVRAADLDPEQLDRRGLDKGYGTPSAYRQKSYPYLNTTPVLFGLNTSEGAVIVELFGGIGAGVEACLANGMPISYMLYSDTNPVAKVAMWNRLEQLHATYPQLLPRSTYREVFKLLPDDVCNITTQHLEAVVALAMPGLLTGGQRHGHGRQTWAYLQSTHHHHQPGTAATTQEASALLHRERPNEADIQGQEPQSPG